ncbi:SDR family NAD(P)-dependent oxidoreductase [Alicyclobacillus kakegawensis]|uniref:SDR family NAD(P)-dependent oxidoreductase n=1 Tax=Alicyclobacillus kakegawensis TaxID=392012 RepID=UPI00082E294A|nr:SDR family NAD(P)-dependent oxidoreductase [Alicyclobacillus kakegawensis]
MSELKSTHPRIALVVGGRQGIGKTIANVLAKRGYTVIATSRAPVHDKDRDHCPYQLETLDVTDLDSVNRLVTKIALEYPYLNVLVNNAGIAGPTAPIDEIADDEWEQVFRVNVQGVFRMCKSVLALMERSMKPRRIINIASMTGKRPLYHRVPYAASKMALIGLTRSLALELGSREITVNSVSPGYVEGSRIQAVIESQARARGIDPAQVSESFLAQSPLHRFVSPDSVAHLVAFLASEEAEDITGADFGVTTGVWMD